MGEHGMTLVEMLTVICVIGILTAIGTLSFNQHYKRADTEKQTRTLYSELLSARMAALNSGRSKAVKVRSDCFEVYSSAADDDDGARPVQRFPLNRPVASNKAIPVAITFDASGVTNDECSICTADDSSSTGADSVVVAATRIRIGKRSPGQECKSEKIAVQ